MQANDIETAVVIAFCIMEYLQQSGIIQLIHKLIYEWRLLNEKNKGIREMELAIEKLKYKNTL